MRRAKGPVLVAALGMLLAACSQVPDSLNPVNIVKDTGRFLSGDTEVKSDTPEPENRLVADRDKPPPGSGEGFPDLSSVPERSSVRAGESGSAGSSAGAERRYSGEVIERQGEASRAVPPPSPAVSPPAPDPQPAPPAPQPRASVEERTAEPPAAEAPQQAAVPPPAPAAPAPAPAQSTQPQLREVTPPAPAPARSLPNIVIPAENPDAPQLAEVKPYVPPPGLEDLGTIIVSGSQGAQSIAVRSPAQPPRASIVTEDGNAGVPGSQPLSAFNPNAVRGSYQVATILFGNGSAKISANDKRILRQVASQHQQVGGTIRVIGHASKRTRTLPELDHKLVNLRISTQRAQAVARELVRLGANPTNLFVGSVSDSDPRFEEYMPSGEAGNRRAEIFIDF